MSEICTVYKNCTPTSTNIAPEVGGGSADVPHRDANAMTPCALLLTTCRCCPQQPTSAERHWSPLAAAEQQHTAAY